MFDLFLTWTKQHRSELTYQWYRQFLQSFFETIPVDMTVDELKAFHVQQWVDSLPDITNNGKPSDQVHLSEAPLAFEAIQQSVFIRLK